MVAQFLESGRSHYSLAAADNASRNAAVVAAKPPGLLSGQGSGGLVAIQAAQLAGSNPSGLISMPVMPHVVRARWGATRRGLRTLRAFPAVARYLPCPTPGRWCGPSAPCACLACVLAAPSAPRFPPPSRRYSVRNHSASSTCPFRGSRLSAWRDAWCVVLESSVEVE